MTYFGSPNHKKSKLEQKNKMADRTKMAAKHEFSMAQSIFIQINRNLGFGMRRRVQNLEKNIRLRRF
jgi:hypothetical protein